MNQGLKCAAGELVAAAGSQHRFSFCYLRANLKHTLGGAWEDSWLRFEAWDLYVCFFNCFSVFPAGSHKSLKAVRSFSSRVYVSPFSMSIVPLKRENMAGLWSTSCCLGTAGGFELRPFHTKNSYSNGFGLRSLVGWTRAVPYLLNPWLHFNLSNYSNSV